MCVCIVQAGDSNGKKMQLPGWIAGYCGFDVSGWVLQHAEVGRALSATNYECIYCHGALFQGCLENLRDFISHCWCQVVASVYCSSFAATLLRFICDVEIPAPALGAGRSAAPLLSLPVSFPPHVLVLSTLVAPLSPRIGILQALLTPLTPKFDCHHTLPMASAFFLHQTPESRRSGNKQPELCNALQQSFRVQLALIPTIQKQYDPSRSR